MTGAFFNTEPTAEPVVSVDVGSVPTDVEGVFADGMKDNLPVFDVDQDVFYNNMKVDRKRLRFKPETSASNYLKSTKYNKPFYIQSKTDNGHFMRKVK